MHLPGPERHVHEREALEDLILDRLRPASPHPDDTAGLFALEPPGLTEVREEAAVGGLTD
jgi:hypothetical protein